MIQRPAQIADLDDINSLIRNSKSYWGYSSSFLEDFMTHWGVKKRYLYTNEVILFEAKNELIGLFAFKMDMENTPELDLFFVNPTYIGKGVGRSMWQQALFHARHHGWSEFKIITDPHAEQFYKHMGAQTTGIFESFPGRLVPRMTMHLDGASKHQAPLNQE